MTDTTTRAAPPAIPLSLFAFAVFYGGMVCIAGVFANKQVELFALPGVGMLAVEAGIFAFLMLVVTSSAVTELFGAGTGRRMVLFGFVPLLVSSALTLLILALPPASEMEAERLDAFNLLLSSTPRIWLGGIVAYGISTLLNVWIFDKLRRPGGRLLWLRSAVAGMVSQALDTLIFVTIAFYGVFPIANLMLGQMLAKVVLSAVLFPPLIYAMVALARRLDAPRRQATPA
ncbi:queuosine precursor transporter [Sphingomicrobium astaxanthinifaciens]|uniref:queuosine precursor transporter n=1 Tax=Sphingomicrobium astaxanthinifaciens TaxID=1227949 RepID=UPI001FCBB5C9|nr:queuosine precursor transporter [Sphingomicrobium astaxanthinifaciens]MCJ7420482.1 queuosine precursor transporter [Sphingomicrobium astaxanthinifaciens]